MRPNWLRVKLPAGKNFIEIKSLLRKKQLHTVCEEAVCPNIGECFEQRTATFLILGNTCTRRCGFCAVQKGIPFGVDDDESERIADAVKMMGLRYVVITSVTRDDLSDGGASVYARTIQHIHDQNKNCRVEVLIPDFSGSPSALETVFQAKPDVVNHNIETVPRLYTQVRPLANYTRSLELLQCTRRKSSCLVTKSGLMVGLGEEWDEIIRVMRDIRDTGCDILTLGQYLSPNKNSLPVQRYYSPEEFQQLKQEGEHLGFRQVESGPLVRSSYHAEMHHLTP